MRILFITTQFPYPLDNGGKIGAFNGLNVLSDYEVHLLSFSEQDEYIENGQRFLSEKFPSLMIEKVIHQDIHIKNNLFKLAHAILKSYLGSAPYMITKFENKEMYKAIDEVLMDKYFDFIFIDYLNMNNYGEYIRNKHRDKFGKYILKDHNIEYEIFKQTSDKYPWYKRILTDPIWKKTKEYEERSVRNADIVFSVCDENTEYFKAFNNNSYSMKPTLDMKLVKTRVKHNHKMLYIGNLSWGANLDGLKWFVSGVMPLIKSKYSDAELAIVGSGNAENPFSDLPEIKWIGFVEDITKIYDEYEVFIVPLFEGSGIRIKILDAFNYEIPVVSTSLACNSIGCIDGDHIMIADTEEEFAGKVITLLEDDALRKSLISKAKSLLETEYTLEVRKSEVRRILLNKQ